MVTGNDLLDAFVALTNGQVREWWTDSYDDAVEVRDFFDDYGMRVRVSFDDDGWLVERVRDEYGRWFP